MRKSRWSSGQEYERVVLIWPDVDTRAGMFGGIGEAEAEAKAKAEAEGEGKDGRKKGRRRSMGTRWRNRGIVRRGA